MKQVTGAQELVHWWANRTQESGRTPGGKNRDWNRGERISTRLSFHGPELKSYGHWPIACHGEGELAGKGLVFFRPREDCPSLTTRKQYDMAWQATRHLLRIVLPLEGWSTKRVETVNAMLSWAAKQRTAAESLLSRLRSDWSLSRQESQSLQEGAAFRQVMKKLGRKKAIAESLAWEESFAQRVQQRREKIAEAEAKSTPDRQRRVEKRLETLRAQLPVREGLTIQDRQLMWRQHRTPTVPVGRSYWEVKRSLVGFNYQDKNRIVDTLSSEGRLGGNPSLPLTLRFRKGTDDRVETSQGAVVSLKSAEMLYALLTRHQELSRLDLEVPPYKGVTVTQERNGKREGEWVVKVGCHTIPESEAREFMERKEEWRGYATPGE